MLARADIERTNDGNLLASEWIHTTYLIEKLVEKGRTVPDNLISHLACVEKRQAELRNKK
jgi:hypothetical protein